MGHNYSELDEIKYEPNLTDEISPKAQLEISRMLTAIYDHINAKQSKLEALIRSNEELKTQLQSQVSQFQTLLEPFLSGDSLGTIATSGESVDASQVNGVLSTSNIPNLDSSKITTGAMVETPDAFNITAGVFAVAGKITLIDNDGNSVEVLTP